MTTAEQKQTETQAPSNGHSNRHSNGNGDVISLRADRIKMPRITFAPGVGPDGEAGTVTTLTFFIHNLSLDTVRALAELALEEESLDMGIRPRR